jgi:hypothetical protein
LFCVTPLFVLPTFIRAFVLDLRAPHRDCLTVVDTVVMTYARTVKLVGECRIRYGTIRKPTVTVDMRRLFATITTIGPVATRQIKICTA